MGNDDRTDTLFAFVSGDPPASALPVSDRIGGRFAILGMLGQGGMGAVYRAHDRDLDEEVAIKLIRGPLLAVPGVLDRFRREVKLARRITHPNVVRIFDLGEADGEHYLTMELIRGGSLAQRLAESRPGPNQGKAWFKQLCAGVQAAHRVGVVHCDLKPDNILVDDDGRLAIADFGIARARAVPGAHGTAGTPAYMAPEQATGAEVGTAADQYALGAILYELVAGASPWAGATQADVLRGANLPAPDLRAACPRVPTALADVIRRAMAPDPADRFPDVADLVAALEGIDLANGGFAAPRPSMPARDGLSVLVLPLAADPADRGLADQIVEDLADTLAVARTLRVRPPSAARGLPPDVDPQTAGVRLGADTVVSGRLSRRTDGLRLTLRAISVADGFQVWTDRVDVLPELVLTIGDGLGRALAGALSAPIRGSGRVASQDPQVVQAYLEIRTLLRSWRPEMHTATRLARAALARTPDDPLLLSVLAQSLALEAFAEQGDTAALRQEGLVAARRALALAPDLGDAWLGLARIHWYGGEYGDAVRALREAVERAPGLARAQEMLGIVLLEAGSLEEGILRLESALSLDPTSGPRIELARAWALRGDWERCDGLLTAPFAEPGAEMGRVLHIARFKLWRRPGDPPGLPIPVPPGGGRWADSDSGMPGLGFVDAVSDLLAGDAAPWDRLRDSISPPRSARLRLVMRQFSIEGQCLRDPTLAIPMLEDAVDEGLLDRAWIERSPALDPIRADPRFAELAAVVIARAEGLMRP